MLGKIAFAISISGFSIFIITVLSNLIMKGFYGLSDSKYKLMGSLAIASIFFGIFLVMTSPGLKN